LACFGGGRNTEKKKLERSSLRNVGIVLRVFGVDLGDNAPSHIGDGIATGDGAGDIDLDGIHGADMMHEDADGATVAAPIRASAIRLRSALRKTQPNPRRLPRCDLPAALLDDWRWSLFLSLCSSEYPPLSSQLVPTIRRAVLNVFFRSSFILCRRSVKFSSTMKEHLQTEMMTIP
jgi:hypothetical protein